MFGIVIGLYGNILVLFILIAVNKKYTLSFLFDILDLL